MLKKVVVLSALLLASYAAQANSCETMELKYNANSDSVKECQSLGLAGAGKIQSCVQGKAQLTVDGGAQYEMAATANSWRVETSDVDTEMKQVTLMTIQVDLVEMTFQGHQVTTDSKGHLRSKISCAGTLSFK